MASRTQMMRGWYPEVIVGGVDDDWNVIGDRPICDRSICGRVKFLAGGDYSSPFVSLKFHPVVVPWAMAMAAVYLHFGYSFDERAGGSCSCRKITGSSDKTSLHAHCVPFDINPSRNRYRVSRGLIQWGRQTDMSMEMVRATEAIRTNNGKAVTQWGGRWTNIKDAMHSEPSKCTRTDLETGIDVSTVVGWREYLAWVNDPGTIPPELNDKEDEMQLPLRKGDGWISPPSWSQFTEDRSHKKEDVEALQGRLGFVEAQRDGLYGSDTAGRVAAVLDNGSDGEFVGGDEWNTITMFWLAGMLPPVPEPPVPLPPLPHDHDDDYASKTHGHEAITTITTTTD